jgi:hypothetical protein
MTNWIARFPGGVKAAISTVILSIIASAFWEALVKPGTGMVGEFVVWIFSSVSSAYLDGIFRNAVMDPTALPALIILGILLISLPGALVLSPVFRKSSNKSRGTSPDEVWSTEQVRRWVRGLALTLTLLGLFSAYAYYNAAIWASRVIRNDLVLCKPYMSGSEFDLISAEFASVQTKTDFDHVHQKLEVIAKRHQVKLTAPSAWYIQ